MGQLGEQPGQETLVGQRARAIGDHHGHAVRGGDQLAERSAADGRADGGGEGGGLVRQAVEEFRGQHRGVEAGEVEFEAGGAVVEVDFHAVMVSSEQPSVGTEGVSQLGRAITPG